MGGLFKVIKKIGKVGGTLAGGAVYDTENANTSGWQHKMYYNTGRQLYADNFNSLPAEEGGGGGGPSGSITPTLRLAG